MQRDYILHESTISLCPVCLERLDAKIIFRDNKVFILKNCASHGEFCELLEEDIEYFLSKKEFDKPGTISKTQSKKTMGCPFDCGLCTEHDQHTCIGLIEITNKCNLACPVCYANSGKGNFLGMQKISEMLDFLIESEGGTQEILQISGGEPTLHPELIKIIELARTKKIKYVMLNTNGLLIDDRLAEQLGRFRGGFEVYLQFDGFKESTYRFFRGKNLLTLKKKAIDNLVKNKVPITLVSTIENKVNEDEIGGLIKFGMRTNGIRGINFQAMCRSGREKKTKAERITLSGIVNQIYGQLPGVFEKGDILPLPCDTERVAVSYLLKNKAGKFIPLTRKIRVKSFLPLIDNTFLFETDSIKRKDFCNCLDFFRLGIPIDFQKWEFERRADFIDANTFRVSITSFVDRFNFDLKSMQKECIHVVTPELRKIPFSAYNMLYRK